MMYLALQTPNTQHSKYLAQNSKLGFKIVATVRFECSREMSKKLDKTSVFKR